MKKIYLLLLLLSFSPEAFSATLEEALVKTYQNNPKLNSSRKSAMASDELVPQAISGWRPTVTAGGKIYHTDKDTNPNSSADGSNSPKKWDVSITQPIYQGGATISSTNSAKNTVKATHETLRATENTVLLSAVESYVNVIRDRAILDLNKKNEQVLRRNLEATKARFDVGELTRTDVSQSEASLSNAIADVVTSQGDLNSSIAIYQSVVGEYPDNLINPEKEISLPKSKQEAIDMALKNNPTIVSSKYLNEAAQADVSTAVADLMPEIDLVGTIDKTYDSSSTVDSVSNGVISANLTVPLYKSGSSRSKIRQAKHTANQARIDVITAQRDVEADVISAWEAYESAKYNISAREDQIKANEVALAGVEQEELVGARTILDLLDAEQELLDSKVELVKANRDKIYKSYELIANIGSLTARNLSLPVDYWNANDNYNKVKNKWWGTGVN
jgi:outer membrane protein/adhesin transport system outer membrane protein